VERRHYRRQDVQQPRLKPALRHRIGYSGWTEKGLLAHVKTLHSQGNFRLLDGCCRPSQRRRSRWTRRAQRAACGVRVLLENALSLEEAAHLISFSVTHNNKQQTGWRCVRSPLGNGAIAERTVGDSSQTTALSVRRESKARFLRAQRA
jgi:hypothetical protein